MLPGRFAPHRQETAMKARLLAIVAASAAVAGLSGTGAVDQPGTRGPPRVIRTEPLAGTGEQPTAKRPASGGATPAEPVAAYIQALREGRPYDAVERQIDTNGFLSEVFGSDLDALSAPERAYVQQLAEVSFKAMVTIVPMDQALKMTN